ncbi:tetratricopeptide repeat-containing sensor histidine kinase [Taibaiella koreensis]|uniref:tetratricopeptide repeat-containing sensor histidine kinase n=1 Tax=Taibaiella koreensis TaxID=1268548 RepID=UPI000E59D008|nr:ATP-binding protein [Taibaiella koreensis]
MLRKSLIVSLLLFSFALRGQKGNPVPDLSGYKTIQAKLEALLTACGGLREGPAADMITVARLGLHLSPSGDFYHLTRFSFYIGSGYWGITAGNDSAIHYMELSLYYAREGRDAQKIRSALNQLLLLYSNTPGYADKRDKTALQVQYILDTTHSDVIKSDLYTHLATYYNELGMYEKAVQYKLSDLDISTRLMKQGKFSGDDTANYGVAFIAVGEAYLAMEQPAKALEYIRQARPYFYDYKSGVVHYYSTIIAASLGLDDMAASKLYYDSLTQMGTEQNPVADQWYQRVAVDLSFTDYYLQHKDTGNAWIYVSRARKLVAGLKDEVYTAEVNFMMGRVLVFRGEYAKALPLLRAAEPFCRDQSKETYAYLLQTMAQCYGALGQWQQAYEYYRKYDPIHDSITTQAAKQSIANAEARYQNKDKQQQIEGQKIQLAYAGRQRLWLIAGLSLSGLVALLLMIIYRNKKRTADVLDDKNRKLGQMNNELEEANRTKARLFGIISHDLRSPINQVYQFLKLQQLDPDRLTEAQKTRLSDKIQMATGSLLETMEDLLLWSKTQMNAFVPDKQPTTLKPLLDQCFALLRLNMEARHISVIGDIPDNTTVQTDPYFLQTILRNLLQNAVKAAPAHGSVQIGYEQKAGCGLLFITNKGDSFTQLDYERVLTAKEDYTSLSGLGLKLVHELAGKAGIGLWFAADGTTGTKVVLSIPLH